MSIARGAFSLEFYLIQVTNRCRCGDESFVLKRVSKATFHKSRQHLSLFSGSTRLRLHVDGNEEELTLVYKWYKGNFFSFMKEYNLSPPIEASNKVLLETGKGINEMHVNGWMHMGKMGRSRTVAFRTGSDQVPLRFEAGQHPAQLGSGQAEADPM
jgi:hypothetical protein